MKRLLIFLSALIVVMGCGTVHKVANKLKLRTDSSASLRKDSTGNKRVDSVSRVTDKSVVITTEHQVNDLVVPGIQLAGQSRLDSLRQKALQVVSPDGEDTLRVSLNDSVVIANLSQRAHVLHQTIDRVIQAHKDLQTDTKVSTLVHTDVNTHNKTAVVKKQTNVSKDVVKTGISGWWYVAAALLVVLLFAAYAAYRIWRV